MKAFFREPLFHFALLGAAVFMLHSLVSEPPPEDTGRRVEIDAFVLNQLTGQFQAVWKRPPTESELSAIVDNHIEEEVLVREALALGLDRGDAIVRQRLALKMRFILEAGIGGLEASDAELAAHLAQNVEKFQRPALIDFEQVFLAAPDAAPGETLAALRMGADPESVSGSTLLPARMTRVPAQAVDNTFGVGFFARIAALPAGEWQGPVESAYGMHLVQVTHLQQAQVPPLSDIRDAVLSDWRVMKTQAEIAARLAALRASYDIRFPDEEQATQ